MELHKQSLLRNDSRQPTLKAGFQKLRAQWREMTKKRSAWRKNNRIFIGLRPPGQTVPKVPLNGSRSLTARTTATVATKAKEELEATAAGRHHA